MQDSFHRTPSDAIKRSRFRGCLLGGAVGDALGAPVEFMNLADIRRSFGPGGICDYAVAHGRVGAITDDTQMTLFTAEGLLRAHVRAALHGDGPMFGKATAQAYLRWLRTQGVKPKIAEPSGESGWLLEQRELFSRRAPGNTCLAALRALTSYADRACNASKGCGGVMRVAPVGMFVANWINDAEDQDDRIGQAFAVATDIAAITHGHPTGQLTAGAFAVVIALLLVGLPLPDAIDRAKTELRKHDRYEETLAAIENAEQRAADRPGQTHVLQELGEGWVAEEALAISLYCALSAPDFESGVVLAVNHGGDSDSTGAITGNMLGAMMGVDVIPERWRVTLELADAIGAMADDLATVREWRINHSRGSAERDFYHERYPPCSTTREPNATTDKT
ncbi:ADP-ribosylglycohydrolase family protein [Paraburkholderia elongata]|uniref:ADP-ribosylglycohydrolase family protein n=1 Tax=Paraburkholderia elongata TaxID=2675747 RepID=A0A972NYU2_9BURK|nr:ADP-ribosylglycohydrolase family protein [Paraburkholderia elongata]NPT54890.1 ADP-ribosylglycohydrolase family protein [Paraburkholderia elongata]NPT60919.1 ADP-ribosylglycohydrolase family protein [Paraburkholderia elongata]